MPDEMDRVTVVNEAWLERCLSPLRLPTTRGTLNCEYCDAEIPERRRSAMPSAVRCVGCQEMTEKGLRA